MSTAEKKIKSRHLTPEAHVDIGLLPLEYEARRRLILTMSSKAMARQRIVPAIPHQLTVRRAKVVPAGKSDQQPAGDKRKNASLSTSADKSEAALRTNGIDHEDAHHEKTELLNGAKDEQAKQAPAEEEPVAIKELSVNKEPLEKEKLVENKEELTAEKEVIDEKKKEVNGKSSIVPSSRIAYRMLSNK